MNPPANDPTQEVTLFREILYLPLRLSSPEDKELLGDKFKALPEHWAVQTDNLAFQNASKVWPIRSVPVDDKSTGDYQLVQAYNEAAYFHPYVQRFLYGFGENKPDKRPIQTRVHNGIDRIKVKMAYNGYKGAVKACPAASHFEIVMAVDRIELNHVREPGMIILIVELACRADTPLRRFDGAKEIDGPHLLSMAEVLALKDGVRRLYPPYFTGLERERVEKNGVGIAVAKATWADNLFPTSVQFLGSDAEGADTAAFGGDKAFAMAENLAKHGTLPIAPWWYALLEPLLKAKGKSGKPLLQQVVDERMPSLSFVAVPAFYKVDPPTPTHSADAVAPVKNTDFGKIDRATQTRLCFADGPGNGYLGTESFLADFEKKHCYDRFLSSGTRYMFSSYSLTVLCQTDVKPCGNSPKGDDFALDTLQQHVRRHYLRMMMLAQIQRASLLAFSNWISNAMHDNTLLQNPHYRTSIDNLRHSFAKFTQISWFSNVSNQEQARDMFEHLQRHLGNAKLQTEVSSELDGARAVLTEIDTERQAESAMVFNVFAATATIIGLPLAAISTWNDIDPSSLPSPACLQQLFAVLLMLLAAAITIVARLTSLGSALSRTRGRGIGLYTAYIVSGILFAVGFGMLL